MTYLILKAIITAIIVVLVSEIAKKSSLFAAIIVSIPLTSLLAFIWLYLDTKDVTKVINLSYNTIIMVIPSFIFFISLPILLKLKLNFSLALILSIIITSITYYLFIISLERFVLNL